MMSMISMIILVGSKAIAQPQSTLLSLDATTIKIHPKSGKKILMGVAWGAHIYQQRFALAAYCLGSILSEVAQPPLQAASDMQGLL